MCEVGYKAILISTIVDLIMVGLVKWGYKAILISTIVDLVVFHIRCHRAIKLF